MNFKAGDRVIRLSVKGFIGTVQEVAMGFYDVYIPVRWDNYKYDNYEMFSIVKINDIRKVTKLDKAMR